MQKSRLHIDEESKRTFPVTDAFCMLRNTRYHQSSALYTAKRTCTREFTFSQWEHASSSVVVIALLFFSSVLSQEGVRVSGEEEEGEDEGRMGARRGGVREHAFSVPLPFMNTLQTFTQNLMLFICICILMQYDKASWCMFVCEVLNLNNLMFYCYTCVQRLCDFHYCQWWFVLM